MKAVVQSKVNPRSYVVLTENGQTFRRNRRQLLKTKEVFQRDFTMLSDPEGDNVAPSVTSTSSTERTNENVRSEMPQGTNEDVRSDLTQKRASSRCKR